LLAAVDVGATIEAEADDILSEAWDAIKAMGRDQAGMWTSVTKLHGRIVQLSLWNQFLEPKT